FHPGILHWALYKCRRNAIHKNALFSISLGESFGQGQQTSFCRAVRNIIGIRLLRIFRGKKNDSSPTVAAQCRQKSTNKPDRTQQIQIYGFCPSVFIYFVKSSLSSGDSG